MKNLQEQVEKAFCYQKLFWPFTVWTNCSSDLKIFRSLEQFFLTQNTIDSCISSTVTQKEYYLHVTKERKCFHNFQINFKSITKLIWFLISHILGRWQQRVTNVICHCHEHQLGGGPIFFCWCSTTYTLWQYRLWSFKHRDTQLEIFFVENELVQRKMSHLLKYNNGKTWNKSQEIWTVLSLSSTLKQNCQVSFLTKHFLLILFFLKTIIYEKVSFVKIGPNFLTSALFLF